MPKTQNPKVLGLPTTPTRPPVDDNGLIEAGMSRRGVHFLASNTTCRRLSYLHKKYGLRDSGARYDIGSLLHLAGSHIAAWHQWPGEYLHWREAVSRRVETTPGWCKYAEEVIVLAEHLESMWDPTWEVIALETQLELNAGGDRWITCRLDVLIRNSEGILQIVDFKTAADTAKAKRKHFNGTPQARLFGLVKKYSDVELATAAFWIIPKKDEQRENRKKALVFTAGGTYKRKFERDLWKAVDNVDESLDKLPPGAFDRIRCGSCFAKRMCYGVPGS